MTYRFHGSSTYRNRQHRLPPILSTVLLVVFCYSNAVTAGSSRESYEVDYYSNVSLPCNFTFHNLTYPGIAVPFLRYWILPNATVIRTNSGLDPRIKIVSPDVYTFNLFISTIDDQDYGVYHCFMIWNNINYQSSAIRVGLNEEGPYYKAKLAQLERNVLIGCIAAGGVVVIVLIGCAVCRCRRKKKELSDLDYYSNPRNGQGQDRHIGYEYQIDASTTKEATPSSPPSPKPQSVEEVYAQVNKGKLATAPTGTAPDHTEHL